MNKNQELARRMVKMDLNFLDGLDPKCLEKILEVGVVNTNYTDDRLIVPGKGDVGWPIQHTWHFGDMGELMGIISEFWEITLPNDPNFYADYVSERNGLHCCICDGCDCGA
ncbi:MAG TPA: hypothetical protein PKV63_07490 [Bacilli bacterium]|nr:hypothetical protein [Bacilli bacterium]